MREREDLSDERERDRMRERTLIVPLKGREKERS
jgi:hypothetical protein